MMTKLSLKSFLIILFILILAGCGAPETPPVDQVSPEEEIQEEVPTKEATEVQEEDPTDEPPEVQEIDAEAIFAANCARCHGADRSGGRGPALLPERLTKDPAIYQTTITNGSGGMPSFNNKLSSDEISALVEFILSEPQ
jgi:mono/diheme cytochrome c family protein